MRKIIILFMLISLLTSCVGQKVKETFIQTKKIDKANDLQISFKEVENNFIKLKQLNLKKSELEFLNEELKNIFDVNIEKIALEKNDYFICEKSNKLNINSCKRKIILKNKKINDCKILVNTGSIVSCKNEINQYLANINLDEAFCDKLIDNSEENFEKTICKNNIYQKKARKDINIKICDKIVDKIEKEMCIEDVKIELDSK